MDGVEETGKRAYGWGTGEMGRGSMDGAGEMGMEQALYLLWKLLTF